jgi:DNA-directed RNA polymerase subunit L
MVVYEVNLKILASVFDDYVNWLSHHVRDMLKLDGFQRAKYLSEHPSREDDSIKLTVQYEVDTIANLQNYLDNHSKHMRDDGINKFPDQFSATRRIFEVKEEFLVK